jgi:hypothetical protein
LKELIDLIQTEYIQATKKFSEFNSAHEGLAVIWEEFDELKKEVWKNQKKRNINKMRKEASHVAAMAIRFIIDICHR